MGFIMKGFQPKNTCYANNPGRCPGLYHFRLSAYFHTNRRGYAMDKRGRKDNSPVSWGNDPIALRALPLRQGKFLGYSKKLPCFRRSFWVILKSSPVLGELPAGVRGYVYHVQQDPGLQPISTPIEEAMPWIKEKEKKIVNCQFSIVN